jgi:hypothetical protein
MLLGSVGYEAEVNANGERLIWPETRWVDNLTAVRGPGRELQRHDPAAGDGGEAPHLTNLHCFAQFFSVRK